MKKIVALSLLLVLLAAPLASAAETIQLIRFSKFIQNGEEWCDMTIITSLGGESGRRSQCENFKVDALTLQLLEENLIRFLVAYWMARDPNLGNQNLVLGKTLTIDFTAANPIKVQ